MNDTNTTKSIAQEVEHLSEQWKLSTSNEDEASWTSPDHLEAIYVERTEDGFESGLIDDWGSKFDSKTYDSLTAAIEYAEKMADWWNEPDTVATLDVISETDDDYYLVTVWDPAPSGDEVDISTVRSIFREEYGPADELEEDFKSTMIDWDARENCVY